MVGERERWRASWIVVRVVEVSGGWKCVLKALSWFIVEGVEGRRSE